MSAFHHKLLDHHHHHHQNLKQPDPLQQLKISNKLNFVNANNLNNNLNQNNINNNHNNCYNNYATPTASSVLKQRKQNSTTNYSAANTTATAILSPSKYRKCPLSPLIITTNAPLFSTTSLSSPSQQFVTMTQPLTQHHHFGKLSPASPVLGLTLSPLSPNSTSSGSSSVHLVRTTKTTRLRAAALGEFSKTKKFFNGHKL